MMYEAYLEWKRHREVLFKAAQRYGKDVVLEALSIVSDFFRTARELADLLGVKRRTFKAMLTLGHRIAKSVYRELRR